MLNRQRQQRVHAQLAQLQGELTQLETDEKLMVALAELELEAELEPEAELHARM